MSPLKLEDPELLLGMVAGPVFLILLGTAFGWGYRRRVEAAMRVGRRPVADQDAPVTAPPAVRTIALKELEWRPRLEVRERAAVLFKAMLAAGLAHLALCLAGVWIGQPQGAARLVVPYLVMVPEVFLGLMLLRAGRRVWIWTAVGYLALGIAIIPTLGGVSNMLFALRAAGAPFALYPAAAATLLLSRRVRTAASLALTFLVFFATQSGVVALILLAANLVGQRRLDYSSIAAGLTQTRSSLLVLAAGTQISSALIFLWTIGRDSARVTVLALSASFLAGVLAPSIAYSTGHPLPVYFDSLTAIPLLVLMWYLSWLALLGLNRLREGQWMAPEYDRAFFVWGFLSFFYWGLLGGSFGSILAIAACPVAVLIQRIAIWRFWKRNRGVPGRRLVLLRVFGRPRQTIRLLEWLGSSWRPIGTIDLILGTDVAAFDVSPGALKAFLRGRLQAVYLQTEAAVDRKIASLSRRLGGDGLYPINQINCFENTWRYAVVKFLPEADAVVVDLRGFSRKNRGCVFELRQLLNLVRLDKIVVITGRNTDPEALDDALQQAWAGVSAMALSAATVKPSLKFVRFPRFPFRERQMLAAGLMEIAQLSARDS